MSQMYRLELPERVYLGDITPRDGLQALEHYYSAADKVRLVEELVLAGFKHVEVTNFGHPKFLPQFKDADEVLKRVLGSERIGARLKQNGGDVTLCVVTINERAATRALDFKAANGVGPDFILQMVSTDPAHHKTNSGMSIEDYFRMSERCIGMAKEVGIRTCGTVSTIWGSPMKGSRVTDLRVGVEFSKRYLEIGADYIEQADHDGSGDPARVYEYFKMILDPALMGRWADPRYHLAHFHTTRGMGLANCLAALQAGVVRFETTLSGTGGQPASIVDGEFTGGTGQYYHFEHLYSGLQSTEDFVVMLESMGIQTGIDVLKLLEVGRMFRDEYLSMKSDDRAQLLRNACQTTDLIGLDALAYESDIDDILERAVKAKQPLDKDAERLVRANMECLLRGVANNLRWRAWGPSRAESLLSGPPPSPHLVDILDD